MNKIGRRRELALSKMSDYELLQNMHSDKWAKFSCGKEWGWTVPG